jgi:hypothetical protein
VAIFCAIYVLPTYKAGQFVAKINSGDFSELYSLNFPKRIWQYTQKYSLEDLRIEAVLHPRTWRDRLRFRRRVSVGVWPPPDADKRLPAQDSSYVFVRITGAKFGGEIWE